MQHDERHFMAYSAAAIYGGAAFLNFLQVLTPGGPDVSIVPGIGALAFGVVVTLLGPRAPRGLLMLAGPLGAALIAVGLATTHDYSDGAVLYMWPVLWMSFFFGIRGTVFMVAWVGLVHAVALHFLPDGIGNVDRWTDVFFSVAVVGAVVRVLASRAEEQMSDLRDEARVDPLTGLLNRRGFGDRVSAELARAGREETCLSVVAFDIDHFKLINDRHGHEFGDRVLSWLGWVIRGEARESDVTARVGGEEFTVLLPSTRGDEAHGFAERIRSVVEHGGPAGSRAGFGVPEHLSVTVSAGVASSADPLDLERLLAEADQALYAAKRAGRNRVELAAAPGTTSSDPKEEESDARGSGDRVLARPEADNEGLSARRGA